MKRKILSLVMAFCLVFSAVLGTSSFTSAQSNASVPVIGKVISGFSVKETSYDQSTKSTKILFEHVNTGAKLLVIKNRDINRGFSIKFNTPTDNDKGINHIIEHSVLGGSKKYPSKNIIFDVQNTTYTSFANAFTYPNMTIFPICSESEQQLLKSADVYLDVVFNPLLLSDKRIFEREGWRLELADEKSDIIYNGIVYNEMQGNMGSIESTAVANAMKAIFPDSNQGNNAGGDPSQITKLTYEEFVKTYKANYHPSNSFMVLYGDVNYEPFLKMIDEDYLSGYSKKYYNINRNQQKPFEKLVEKTYTYSAAAGSETKNKSVIDLVFATKDIKELGMEKYVALNIAVSLLSLDSSSIKKAMLDSKIAESYTITMDPSTFQPTIHFMATNADPLKKNDFYNLIMSELKKIIEEGLDSELVKSSLRSMEFSESLGNNANSVVNAIVMANLYDNLLENPLVDYNSCYKDIVANLNNGVLEDILEKQILNNTLAALTVTSPVAGQLEKNQAEIKKTLTEKKSLMTAKEIKNLVKKTVDFSAWNNQETPANVLKSLRAVELKDIKAELKEYEVNETNIDGVDLWTAKADVDTISAVYLIYDMKHLTQEELLYLRFYNDMIGSGMATKKRTESQVMNETTLNTYGLSTSLTALNEDVDDKSAYPIYVINYCSFEDDYDKSFDLVYDILLQSNVDDIVSYGKRTIANMKASYESQFAEPLSLAMYRSMAYTSASYRFYNYLYGLDYYHFILSLEKQITTEPAKVAEKLKAIREKAFNKNNLDILFAGDSSAETKFKSSLNGFTNKMPNKSYQNATYSLPVPSKREAFVTNSTVQYVVVNGSLSKSQVPSSGKGTVITSMLNNLMLTPEIRLKGGAYGVSAAFENDNYVTFTYRDSNYVNSLTTIGGTDVFLKTVLPYITEDILESYKLSAYAAASMSSGELNSALRSLLGMYQGVTIQDRINALEDIKNTTLSDIEKYAEYLSRINQDLNYVVVASPADIEANKDLFDTVIKLQ